MWQTTTIPAASKIDRVPLPRVLTIGFVLDDTLDKTDGVQQYVITIGEWLRSQGHDVHYLVGRTERKDLKNIHSLSRNVRVTFNKNEMSMPVKPNMAKISLLMNTYKFDVLHVQMPYSPFLAAKVIKSAPATTAVVGTFHILPYSQREAYATRLLSLWVRKSRKRLDAVVSVSAPASKFARKYFRVRSEVVPNAIRINDFQRATKYARYDDGKITVVFLGRLVERKGCMYLLQALATLHKKKQLFNVRVLICGKGPMEAELKKYVSDNHLGSIVHFTGFVSEPEKTRYLASANIAVFPSTGGESFGIVLIEAMAAGAQVVIAGKNSGYTSVMAGHSGQIVRPRDIEAFARLLKHYMRNGHARKQAAKWQHEHVKSYDVTEVGNQLVHMYRRALESRR